MVFWQLTIDANDPALLARFWAQALGYPPNAMDFSVISVRDGLPGGA